MVALRVEPGTKEYELVKKFVEMTEAKREAEKFLKDNKEEVVDLVGGLGEVIVDEKVVTLKEGERTNVSWKGVAEEAINRLSKSNKQKVEELRDNKYTSSSTTVSVVIEEYKGPKGADAAAEAFASPKKKTKKKND